MRARSRLTRTATALGVAAVLGAILAAPAGAQPRTSAPAFVVVVNPANPAASLTRDQLARLFLRKTGRWPNGRPARPVDLASASAARVAFTKSVIGRSVPAVQAYWQQQIFSGGEVPPPERASAADVLAYVRSNADAVGYIEPTAPIGAGVKVLAVQE